jgi:signal transduction histidine kinase
VDYTRGDLARRAGVRGGLALPVLADGALVAVFVFHVRHAGAADPAELDRLAAVAAQVGAVVRRRQAEAALAAEREFLRAVLESLTEGVAACDDAGRPTLVNRALRAFHGLPAAGDTPAGAAGDAPPAEWAAHHGLCRADGVTPLTPDEVPLARALRGEVVRGAELVIARPGAPPRTVVASGQRVTGPDGRGLGAVVALHDVTERAEAERRKSEFVSTVSHELRTPLTSIRGSLGLLDGGAAGPLPDKAASLVRLASSNVERLVRLVNDVLDLQKIDAGRMEYAITAQDPADVVGAAAEGIAGLAAAAHVDVVTRVGARAAVRGDRDRLLQVLTNLLSNAIKFSPADAAVVVSASDRTDAAGAPMVRFAVEDRGPGIPPDKLALLFQRFRQLDGSDSRRHGGTGLGLAISKTIVEQHGGRVGVESEPGRRTVFWCDLPADPAAVPAAA